MAKTDYLFMKKDVIPSLTGLRAVSIMMVICYHLSQRGFFPANAFLKYFGWFFFNGQLGVNIFFIISGFLITTLLIAEKQKKGHINLKNFYIRRTIRIFPAYYVFIAVLLLLQVVHYFNFPWTTWLCLLTYTKQFFPFYGHEVEHLWSLSVEEFFYLFWPICFIKIKRPLPFIYVMIAFFAVSRFVLFQYPQGHFANSIFTTGDALLIGCLIAIKADFFKELAAKSKKIIWLLLFLIAVSLFVYNYFYHLGQTSNSIPGPYLLYLQKISYAFFGSIGLITNLLIGVLIVYCVQSRGFFYKILNTSPLVYIGTLSYSIYLWQQLFTADRTWLHHLPLIIILLMIVCASLLSYYFVEKPFLKLKRYFEMPKGSRVIAGRIEEKGFK